MSARARVAAGLALLGAACQTLPAPPGYRVHHTLLDGSRELPERILVLPVWMVVYDASAPNGGEIVETWSVAAQADLTEAFEAWGADRSGLTVFRATDVHPKDPAFLEHLSLFHDLARAAYAHPSETAADGAERRAWWPRVASFDASVGPGLAPLASQGAEAALVAVGKGVVEPDGHPSSVLHVGLIHLRSGDLLWLGRARDTRLSLASTTPDVPRLPARELVDLALADYPGLAEYEAFRRAGGAP